MHPPARIGRYELLSVLGRGGMGEVYRARDTKLGRDVAIKALPEEFARDPERLARLEDEARALAALNHPNVAAIYGLEEHDGTTFLVLELVDGITLADRLRTSRLRIDQVLEIAAQIAAGLEAAHDADVVHRDLKPANVNVTAEGRVKVLDFGLAKTLSQTRYGLETRTARPAEPDVGVGSAAYMSPEQARGVETNRQTDVWSFGVVLYEMLTGRSLFARGTTTETLACVLEASPDFARLPPATPPGVQRLVRRCLERDPRRRLRDIGDAKIELEDTLAALAAGVSTAHTRRPSFARRAAAVAAALALVALGTAAVWSIANREPRTTAPAVVRFSVSSTGRGFSSGGGVGVEHVAISPDGSRTAHAVGDSLSIRRLSDARSITIDAPALDPFFSPNGEWVAFFQNGVRKMRSDGDTPILVAATTDRPAGGTWGEDGTIVFATTAGLYRVSADGGVPEQLASPDRERGELQYAWPRFLPGGRAVLFTIVPQGSIDEAKIARLDLATRAVDVVLTGGTSARHVKTGHLAYVSGGQLMAVPFDAHVGTVGGESKALNIRVAAEEDNGAADFDVASNGTLVYVEPRASLEVERTLAWIGRDGREEPIQLEAGPYVYARVSPDGTRIALDVNRSNRDIWIWDIGRETLTRLTDGPTEDMTPVWSPDSRRVFFSSDRTGNFEIYSQRADSTTATVALVSPTTVEAPSSISPDGFEIIATRDFRDLIRIDLRTGVAHPLLERDAQDWLGEISPDGRWFAYESDESGVQFEVYLRPFHDASGRREKISVDGGRYAHWGPPGSNELYYVALDGSMMVVSVELEPELRIGRATKLFDLEVPRRGITGRLYDVSPVDGRFLVVKPFSPASRTESVQFVLNWFEELRAQVP
jgi:serine/threonine-protein kinase